MKTRTYLLSVLFLAGLAVTGQAQTVNINCGGIAFTATNGTQWSADQDFSGGELMYSGGAIVGAAPQDLNLYRSGRSGLYTDFSYSIPVPNGSYTVTLGFAEIQYSAPTQRVFNVILNGAAVLTNFDILTHVAPLTPYTQQFPVTVTNGAVQLAFNGVTNRGLVNAIQIAPTSGSGSGSGSGSSGTPVLSLGATALSFTGTAAAANPPAQNLAITNSGSGSLIWSASTTTSWLTVTPSSGTGAGSTSVQPNLSGLAAGTYTGSITVIAPGASGSPATVPVTLTISAASSGNPSSQSTVNINCGGIAFTTSDGTQWVPDEDFTNGELFYVGSSIANTPVADYYLYRTARAGLWTDFSYAIPVPNGSYVVTLRFAELQYSAKGQRVFNVVLNGATVLSNFDILANVAALAPLQEQFPVTVTNGAIQLAFNGVVNRGVINAIQVAPASGSQPIPPSLTLGGTSLNFSGTAGGSNPTAQAVTVTNAGGSTLTWTASSSATWLSISPNSGTAPASISVQPNLAGMAAGSYNGTVTVTAPGAGNSPQAVSVALTVSAATPPTLSISTPSLSFSATAGGSNPSTQTVSVSNTGSGTATWTATSNQPWLTVSPASGTNSGILTVGAVVGSLSANTYIGAVTVNGGAAGTKTVNVSFAVAASSNNGGTGSGVTLPPTGGNNWYVSTSGSRSGNGSQSSPWDIVTALAQPASVRPGDTIWLMAGTYGDGTVGTVIQSKLVGTPTSPIIVRAYPGQRATINNWLQVGCCDQANDPANGSYTWFWGLEFASYSTDRSSGTSGPPEWAAMSNHDGADTWGDGTKFINCIFHDTAGGISVWDTNNSEVNGNIIYNVGGAGTDRGHGHLLYLQNNAPSILNVTDNIGFNNFDEGVQAYGSSSAFVQNMNFTGNIVFNAGLLYGNLVDNLLIGGGDSNGVTNITLNSNYTYDTPSRNMGQNEIGYLWDPSEGAAVVTNNYFIGGYQAVDLERWTSLTFQNNTMYAAPGSQDSWMILAPGENPAGYAYNNNTYYGSEQFWVFPSCSGWPCPGYTVESSSQWQSSLGIDRSSTFSSNAPTAIWTFVRPNQYEPGRANIVIYNWPLQSSVSVDISHSGINVGDRYQIRDAENWYNGAVVSGTYTGSPVSIPMSGLTVVQPVGSVPYPPSHTAPQFGVFVLLSGTALTNTY